MIVSNTWFNSNYRYLIQQLRYLRSILNDYIESQTTHSQPNLEEQSCLDTVFDQVPPALENLCSIFNLSQFERKILLLCVGMELDPSFESMFSEVNGNGKYAYPTFSLALTILPKAHCSVLKPQSPLQYWQLIEIGKGQALTKSSLKIDQSILCYLLGEPCLDERLEGIVKPIDVTVAATKKLEPSHQQIASQLGAIWLESTSPKQNSIVQLCGADSTANIEIAITACYCAGCSLRIIKTKMLPSNLSELKQLIRLLERESILSNSALLLDCHDIDYSDNTTLLTIQQIVGNTSSRLIIASRDRLPNISQTSIIFDVLNLTSSEQLTVWLQALGQSAVSLNGQVEALVSQFNLNQQAIYTAVSTAQSLINTQEVKPDDTNNLGTILWDTCRKIARPQLDDLAQRIDTKATWDDLVLPEAPLQTIREMINHVKNRMKVYSKWGFADKNSRGLGITALLAGDSGTGKTMTAEVIANELRLDLYRIDLSSVVSKYIGETEKNTRRVFDAAESGGAVLLFDEADALFSKRTQVKDSHDRNANMEINYLLQRMEAYTGLAILTTNLKDSIDSAFMRRIRFIVKYRFPEIEEREQLWRRIFPSTTPTEGLDYARLGKLCVTGGNIRNIALNATFLAAQEEEPVMMKHIKQAAQTEYLKLGKSLTDVETRGWGC